jgi:hypothetical protein
VSDERGDVTKVPTSPDRKPWEPMSLASVGTFGDVLRGSTGQFEDTGLTNHPGDA